MFNDKEKELKQGHNSVKEELKEKFSKQKEELNKDCEESIRELESKYSYSDTQDWKRIITLVSFNYNARLNLSPGNLKNYVYMAI